LLAVVTDAQDYILPLETTADGEEAAMNAVNILARSAGYVLHVYYAERGWASFFAGSTSVLVQHPEKTAS
jgi:hypothetical protein